LNRQEKEKVVAELTAVLAGSEAVFVTDFKGLKVGEMRNLRQRVTAAGGQYRVVKNTLMRRAAAGTPLEKVSEFIAGNNAVGTTDQHPVPLAKTLMGFAKENQKLVIKGGILSGRALSYDQIKALADLPPREVLLANLLRAMNGVPTGLVRVLSALPGKLVYALAAIRDQKQETQA